MSSNPHDDRCADPFELSLDDMLERVSASSREDQVSRVAESNTSSRRASGEAPHAGASSPAPLVAPSSSAEQARPINVASRRRVALTVFIVLVLAAPFLFLTARHRVPIVAPVAYERLPAPSAGRMSTPPLQTHPDAMPSIATDADASTEALMLEEFEASAPDSVPSPKRIVSDTSAAFSIARYDTLPLSSPNLRVLAPLGVEEVYALVTIHSPLKTLADLRGRRINVGEAGSARSLSGRALYAAMFGRSLPESELVSAPKEIALQSMLHGEPLDALIFFDGQPSRWFAALPVSTRQQLRLLSFQPGDAVGRRALQRYLPASLEKLAQNGEPITTLGEVTFLVGKARESDARTLLESLCRRLPALRSSGHPKWKAVDPTLQLPLDLQRSRELDKALRACEESVAVASVPSSKGGSP